MKSKESSETSFLSEAPGPMVPCLFNQGSLVIQALALIAGVLQCLFGINQAISRFTHHIYTLAVRQVLK